MKRNNRAWMSLMTACLAAVVLLSAAPAAQAHGRGRLRAEVAQDTDPDYIIGVGVFETTRVHHRVHVKTCLQIYWNNVYQWVRANCTHDSRRHVRHAGIATSVECLQDGYYRTRVRGWVKSRSGDIWHSKSRVSEAVYRDCP